MRLLIVTLTLLTLSACAAKQKDKETGLFLRSEFSWWEALPHLQFKKIDESIAVAKARIKRDGNYYHIKIADKAWSNGKNCGVAPGNKAIITLNEINELECASNIKSDNLTPLTGAFKFKPPVDGNYTFILRYKAEKPIELVVRLTSD